MVCIGKKRAPKRPCFLCCLNPPFIARNGYCRAAKSHTSHARRSRAGNRSDVGLRLSRECARLSPITKTVSSGTVTGAISMYGSALLISARIKAAVHTNGAVLYPRFHPAGNHALHIGSAHIGVVDDNDIAAPAAQNQRLTFSTAGASHPTGGGEHGFAIHHNDFKRRCAQ